MEISNYNYTSTPTFGAFIRPMYPKAKALFERIVTDESLYPKKLLDRGLAQIEKDQRYNRYYDVALNHRYNGRKGAFEVRIKDSDEVVAQFPVEAEYKSGFTLVESRIEEKYSKRTKPFSSLEKIKILAEYYLKSLHAYLFNPKEFVNPALRSASDKAIELEKEAIEASYKNYRLNNKG